MRQWRAGMLILLLGTSLGIPVAAQTQRPWRSASTHFDLHTDLNRAEAASYLARMEATLAFAEGYWRRPSPRRIECYLIHDVRHWPESAFPNPLARVVVRRIGGVTISLREKGDGPSDREAPTYAARIYASTAAGVVEHEIMHAYCSQNFGATGPEWYKEGMAELAGFGEIQQAAVRCPPERLGLLRASPARTAAEVREVGVSTQRLGQSLRKMLFEHETRGAGTPLDAWSEADSVQLQRVRDEYLWSWSLCHFLHHNPNYRDRFRMVGEAYMTGGKDTFEQVFAPMQRELAFEYTQFLSQVKPGYRVDLCYWNWNRRFDSLDRQSAITARCDAARGWQPAELLVVQGQTYAFEVAGRWSVVEGERPCNPLACRIAADAVAPRKGRLIGVVVSDLEMSAPFVLGEQRSFVAPATGKLYLRCDDDWHALDDNCGELRIRFMRPQNGPIQPVDWTPG